MWNVYLRFSDSPTSALKSTGSFLPYSFSNLPSLAAFPFLISTLPQTPYPSHPTSTSSAWPKASLPSRIDFPPSPPPPPPLTCLRGTWKASLWV